MLPNVNILQENYALRHQLIDFFLHWVPQTIRNDSSFYKNWIPVHLKMETFVPPLFVLHITISSRIALEVLKSIVCAVNDIDIGSC